MREHTPGPWDAYHINDRGLWCVAKMDSGVCIDPSVANARLIAAAPEMFELLKKMQDATLDIQLAFLLQDAGELIDKVEVAE